MPKLTVAEERSGPVQIHYEDWGDGEPVVLVHGWPLSGRSWEPQVAPLIEAGYRVVTYDRRGFGESSRPWGGYDYDTLAADLKALLDHLDVAGATLVGFSMGGGEVARYLGTYGDGRISRAVFASAVPPYLYKSDDNPDGGLDDATIDQFETGVRTDRQAFADDFATNFYSVDGELKVSPQAQHFAVGLAAVASPKGTLDCVAAFGRTDFRADLAKITVPTLVIHGDGDAVVPFEVSGRRTAESVAGAQLVLLRGAPHGCNVSHAEQFNSALIDFLKST